MSDIIIVRQNTDLLLDNSIKIGTNIIDPTPGTIRYNSTNDKFEGYLENTQAYNSSNWAPMSLGIASPTDLGGVKIGNNLTITGTGVLSSVAGAPSRLLQRVLSVCQRPNTGDYESISECLSDFFNYQFTASPVIDWTTSAGALKNQHDADPVNFPWPDADNIYIIQVSPGVYEELTPGTKLRIPPYVALVGDLDKSVVIKNDTPDGIMVQLSTGSILQNIVIDMSSCALATKGVYCDQYSSDITIKNVEFRTDNLSVAKTAIDIQSSSNVSITDCKSDINVTVAVSPVATKKLVMINTTAAPGLKITDCDFKITGLRNTKQALYLTNNTNADIARTKISIQETNTDTTQSHSNQGVYISDSWANFIGCEITMTGLDNKDDSGTSQVCQGISIVDTNIAPTITPNVGTTTFIHYNNFDDNDEIANPSYNWVTNGGLKIGDYIWPIAPIGLNALNRGIYQIRGISSNSGYVLQLDNSATLEDQSIAVGDLQIKRLYNVSMVSCKISASSQTILVSGAGLGSAFRVQSAYTVLDGQNPEFSDAHYILTVPQQITVGLQDCDFLSLADACDSIKDSSAIKPYEVLVQPGYYIERRVVMVPSYVTVRGQGQKVTKIKFELADSGNTPYDSVLNAAIILGGDATNISAGLMDMTIEIPSGLNYSGSASILRGIYVPASAGVIISNIELLITISVFTPVASNAKIYGIDVSPTILYPGYTYKLNHVVVGITCYSLGTDIRGINFTRCTYSHLQDCNINISCLTSATGRVVYGINADRSKLDVVSPFILVSLDGSVPAETGYGIFSTNSDLYPPAVPPTGDTNYSTTPVLVYGGQIRVKGLPDDITYSVFADYKSTLFAMNTAVQGTAASRNDIDNNYPNSLLKTYKCYYFSESGNTFNNLGDLDPVGNLMGGENENLNIGDPVGCAGMDGTKNVQIGIRTGLNNQFGSRNTMLGVDVGRALNTGDNNVFLGYGTGNTYVSSNATLVGAYAGTKLSSATNQDIVMVGIESGSTATTASNAVIVGSRAARAATTITNSVTVGTRGLASAGVITDSLVVGSNSATSTGSSTRDIIMGTNSGNQLPATSDNMIIGTNAAQRTTTMTNSVLLGNQTGRNRLTTQESVLVGFAAGQGNPGIIPNNIGDRNVAMGYYAGSNMSSGTDNFIAGARAGVSLTEGSYNTLIGSSSDNSNGVGSKITTGSYNFLVGTNTASSLTTGSKNIVLGSESANKLTTQSHNFILGWGSGNELASSNNIIIGNESGQTVTQTGVLIIGHASGTNAQGADTVIIGHNAARGLTGERNTIIGNYGAGATGAVVLSGTDNVLIGPYAGYQLTTGSFNLLIGGGNSSISTGRNLQSGSGNMLFGFQAAPQVQSGSHNLVFGRQAAYSLASGSQNIILGAEAGSSFTSGSENVMIGNEAGKNLSIAAEVVLIGNKAGYGLSGSSQVSDNMFIGNEAGYNVITGSRSTFIGNRAGWAETIGNEHTYIGNKAGWYLNQAYRNICIGYLAGKGVSVVDSQNSTDNIILGSYAGNLLTSGGDNILIGSHAGSNVGAREKNIMIGSYAGALSDASYNIFVGSTTDDPAVSNKAVGYDATGSFNVVMGINAGIDLTTGEKNVIMGFETGQNVTTGSKNIMMGEGAGFKLTSGLNNILLGQNAGVTTDHTTGGLVTGNNVIAIGTSAGSNLGASVQDAILIGTEAGLNTKVDNAICIGYNAGALNSTGAGGISIGYRAGSSSKFAEGCISIGSNAGAAFSGLTTEGQNISIGDEAARTNQGIRAIVIGAEALTNTSNASNVIVIGFQAGSNIGLLPQTANTTPDNSIIIGYRAAATGDIGEDNILVGTQVAENINSPYNFTDNLFMGTKSGQNANLAVNSIAIGNANRIGTGGQTNIIMGTAAGDNVGNPFVYNAATITPLQTGNLSVNINMPYSQAYGYFKDGDRIIISNQNTHFETILASILQIPSDTNNCMVVFSAQYTAATTIGSGAKFNSLAVLETDVGELDYSKASGNSLLGDNAGNQLTSGSKNIGFGTQAMYSNKVGKYNNVVGTQAGYNIISDNNTLLGTRAGYSLDLSTDTPSLTSSQMSFTSNANAIYSSTLTELGDYEFGTVLDISNTTDNDGRYTVELGVPQDLPESQLYNYIVVEGKPVYEELGLPDTVPPNAIKVNAAKFSVFATGLGTGTQVKMGWFEYLGNSYSGIYVGPPNTQYINNLRQYGAIIKIKGSKYNDGLHYVEKTTVGDGYAVIKDKVIDEIFTTSGDDISVRSDCIVADEITGDNDFLDFNYSNPINMFFTVNKGVYTTIPLTKKYQISIPNNNAIYNLVKAATTEEYEKDNIIFETGYKNNIQFSTGETSADYQKFDKFILDASKFSGTILFLNNLIRINPVLNYGIEAGEFYEIEVYNNLGALYSGSTIILVDSIEETEDGYMKYYINSDYPLPGNILISKIVFKKCQIKKLVRNVNNDFATGDIVLFNVGHEYGLKTERGAFVVRDTVSPSQTDNRLLLSSQDCIPDIYYSITLSQDKLWGSNGSYNSNVSSNTAGISTSGSTEINYRILQTNNYIDTGLIQDSSNIVGGWGIFSQLTTIRATGSNVYTAYSANNCIWANNDYEFKDIVAPCYINLPVPPSSIYYLVKENKWPFKKLVIDTSISPLVDATVSNLTVRSLSSRFDTSNLKNVSENFNILGLSDPNLINESGLPLCVSTLSNPKALVRFTFGVSPFTVNSFDTVMTIAAYDNDTPNSTPGFIDGYFKHLELSNSVAITYNNFYDSKYEPLDATSYSNSFVNGKKLIISPDITDSDKYVISNTGNVGSAWVDITALGAPSYTITQSSANVTTFALGGLTKVYGESFSQGALGKNGYLLFDGLQDKYQLAFSTSSNSSFGISNATSNARVWNVAVGSGLDVPGYTLIHYMTDPQSASIDQTGNNNVQVKIFPNSATYKSNNIELCYSNGMTKLYGDQQVIGMERMGTVLKDCRYVTNLSNSDQKAKTCVYEGYESGAFDMNGNVLQLYKTEVTSNSSSVRQITTGAGVVREGFAMYNDWVFTGYSPSSNTSNISVYTNNNSTWTFYEELTVPNAASYININFECTRDKLIVSNRYQIVDGQSDAGEFYYYKYNGSTWNNLVQTGNLNATVYGATSEENFGVSTSISNNKLAVGTSANNLFGRVYVYNYNESTNKFDLDYRIISSDYQGISGDGFGRKVRMYDNYLAVTANQTTGDTYLQQGSVYLFNIESDPSLIRIIRSNEPGSLAFRYFGAEIQFYNQNQILISDSNYTYPSIYGDKIYGGRIYVGKTTDNWNTISSSNVFANVSSYVNYLSFGSKFDVYDDNLIVNGGTNYYSAVYHYDGNNWNNRKEITYNLTPVTNAPTYASISKNGYGIVFSNAPSIMTYYAGFIEENRTVLRYENQFTTPDATYPLDKDIALKGDYMAINSNSGVVALTNNIYLYKFINNEWTYLNKSIALNADSILLTDDYLIAELQTSNSSVNVYKNNNDTWTLQNTVTSNKLRNASGPSPLATYNDYLFMGRLANGYVDVYNYVSNSYVTTINQTGAGPYSNISVAVATNDSYVVIGYSRPAPISQIDNGFINVFAHSDYTTPYYTLNCTSAITSSQYFGSSLSINSSNIVLVGAYNTNYRGAFTVITSMASNTFSTVYNTDVPGERTNMGYNLCMLESNIAVIGADKAVLSYDINNLTKPYELLTVLPPPNYLVDRLYNNFAFNKNYISVLGLDYKVYTFRNPYLSDNTHTVHVKHEFNELQNIYNYTTYLANITGNLTTTSNVLSNIYPTATQTFTINSETFNTGNISIYKNGSISFNNGNYQQSLNVFGGYEFDRVFSSLSSNILTVVYDKVLGGVNGNATAYAELYMDTSVSPQLIKIGYNNLPNTSAGTVAINSLPYNQYNGNVSVDSKSNTYVITQYTPNATLGANLALLESGDIIQFNNTNYYEVLDTANIGGNIYIAVNNTTDDITGLGSYSMVCNEFHSKPTITSQSDTINYNFRNARTLVGTNSDFLRFSQIRRIDNSPYTTNGRDAYVTDSTHNYGTLTLTANNSVSILSNNVVYLRETVPNEYRDLVASNVSTTPNKYIISIGTPTQDPGSNVVLQTQNINTKPIGFIDVLVNDTGVAGNSSINWIINSQADGLKGNIFINSTANTITVANIAPDIAYSAVIPFRNDGIGLINKCTNTFDNILPGTYIRVFDNTHSNVFLVTERTDPLTLKYDPTFYSPLSNETIAFTGGNPFRMDIGFTPNTTVANGIYPLISGQVLSDRIDFNQFRNISEYNPSNTAPAVNYLAVHKLPVFNLDGINNEATNQNEHFYYFNNYKIYDGSMKLLSNAYTSTVSNSTLDFHYSGGVNNRTLMYDIGDHTLLLPASNVEAHIVSNIDFINQTGSYNVTYVSSGGNKYINNPTDNYEVPKLGQLFKLSGSTANNGYYMTSLTEPCTSSRIYINTSYRDFVSTSLPAETITIDSNVIYSNDTTDVDLSVYLPGQKLKVESSYYNNTKNGQINEHIAKLISPNTKTTMSCLYIDYPALSEELNAYCKISKCILVDELCNIALNSVAVNSTISNLTISTQANAFTLFKSGQNLTLGNTTIQLGNINVSSNPTTNTMNIEVINNTGLVASTTIPTLYLNKPITFKVIGTPISTVTDDGIVKFHYTDAQGNNIMIGSFTGQYAGATGLSIHNLFLGNKVGQTNQGSGNIFFGSETGFATDASQGATSYDNKLAIYKNNFIGVPSNPLIGGDFASGRVGIGTIEPDSKLLNTLSTRTLMVVDGKVRAQAFNTFTGTHFVVLDKSAQPVPTEPGMILSSTGKVDKLGLLDNIVGCNLSNKLMDKRVYGVYAGDETIEDRIISHCAAVGEGSILVCSIAGEVENGDYLCSSPVPGLAQLQPDDLLHSYTVAKVIEEVNWQAVTKYVIHHGVEYKVALVACTYHCG